MSGHRIAMVGIGCRYPDADSTEQLWPNVPGGRRAFGRLPDEGMNLEDYCSSDPATSDRFYGLTGDKLVLRVPIQLQPWSVGYPVRAGVSWTGWAGINAYLVLEHANRAPDAKFGPKVQALTRSRQDVELPLVDTGQAASTGDVRVVGDGGLRRADGVHRGLRPVLLGHHRLRPPRRRLVAVHLRRRQRSKPSRAPRNQPAIEGSSQ